MAIHGQAFGGGLEVAMAGHYRVMAPAAQVGQPEVKLGIIPGAAGTQRLPRLAGVAKAVEMCAFGEPIGAADALAAGIVDRIIEGDLLAGAIAFAREVAGQEPPRDQPARRQTERRRSGDLRRGAPAGATRRSAARRRRSRPSKRWRPRRASPSTKAARAKRSCFAECLYSTQSKALIHAFFAERAVSKIPGLAGGHSRAEIRRAAVIGAGTMGGGITMNYANAGIPVIVKETSQEALDRGMATIRKNYAGSVKKGRLTQAAMDERMALITPQLTYDGFDEADIIVEAVFEGMALKKQVFAEIDAHRQAGLHPGVEHLVPRYRRNRLGHRAPGDGAGQSLLQPGERDAAARDRARQGHQPRSDRHVHGAGQETEEGRRAGGKLPRVHRQSHVGAVPARSAVPGGGGRDAWRTSTRRSTISAWRWVRWP